MQEVQKRKEEWGLVVVKRRRKSRWRWAPQLRNFGRLTFFLSVSTWSPTEKENKKGCVSPYTGFGGEFLQENNNVFKLSI